MSEALGAIPAHQVMPRFVRHVVAAGLGHTARHVVLDLGFGDDIVVVDDDAAKAYRQGT